MRQIRPWLRTTSRTLITRFNQWRIVLAQSNWPTYFRNVFRFAKSYLTPHQALVGLTAFILINNALAVRAVNATPHLPSDIIISDPYQIGDTVRLLADYTPNIDENPDAIALTLEESATGTFIKTNPLIATEPGQIDEPTPQPTVASTPQVAQQRSKDTKYTVQIGDTLSGISTKFGLKVASVKVKNNLSDVDNIKPGQELTIPSQDLSEKAVQAADDRKKASQNLAQQSGKAAPKTLTATKGYGLIVPLSHNGISRGLVGGHTGIDYRANIGTPTWAAADGVVVIADTDGWNGGYGKTILLDIGSGKTLRYGHLSQVNVHAGQIVHRGDGIGRTGNTGRSTGPHLHFELRVNGVAKNPFP